MEDFWRRQASAAAALFEFTPLDISAAILANRPELMAAARMSAGRFSRGNAAPEQAVRIRLVVNRAAVPPLPPDLPERLVYTGVEDWITVSAGEWGHGFAGLLQQEAVVVLSSALAADTRLVSRYFIDHYLLNFILNRWAMLHASCVLNPAGHLLVMVAPHNTGKSTTALHLLRAGYRFLADGMALLKPLGRGFLVGGYPIGEVKLRDDVLSLFPEYRGQAVTVREQRKTVVNLRAAHPRGIVDTPVQPAAIHLCAVERRGASQTRLSPLLPDKARLLLQANSMYWNKPDKLAHNQAALDMLLQTAGLYRLEIGTDVAGLVHTLEELAR